MGEGTKVTGEHRSHREGFSSDAFSTSQSRLPRAWEKLVGAPFAASLELEWCCLMTVDVNEVLAQQLAQPLINGHRHLLALELTVPAYVGESLWESSVLCLKTLLIGRLFFHKTVVLWYFTLPLQHTPSERSSKYVNDPDFPTPLHSKARPS